MLTDLFRLWTPISNSNICQATTEVGERREVRYMYLSRSAQVTLDPSKGHLDLFSQSWCVQFNLPLSTLWKLALVSLSLLNFKQNFSREAPFETGLETVRFLLYYMWHETSEPILVLDLAMTHLYINFVLWTETYNTWLFEGKFFSAATDHQRRCCWFTNVFAWKEVGGSHRGSHYDCFSWKEVGDGKTAFLVRFFGCRGSIRGWQTKEQGEPLACS